MTNSKVWGLLVPELVSQGINSLPDAGPMGFIKDKVSRPALDFFNLSLYASFFLFFFFFFLENV